MLGEILLPCMPRPLSLWFGLCSRSMGALGCVCVVAFLVSFSRVHSLPSLICVHKFIVVVWFCFFVGMFLLLDPMVRRSET